MEEAFITFGVFRPLLDRKKSVELHSDKDGVLHLSLCGTRMHVASLDADGSSCGIEVFILKFADLTSVECVGILCSELCNVEFDYSAADLFVRSESDLDISMFEFRMFHHILHGSHDLCDSGLVVRSEESRSVSGDEGLSLVEAEFREFAWLEAQAGHSLERNISTVVVLDDLWLDVVSRCVRSCVCVGDESDCRYIFAAV